MAIPNASFNMYRVRAKLPGATHVSDPYGWHPTIPWLKVGLNWYNPKQIWVKITGAWRLVYTQINWSYYWTEATGWTGCGCSGSGGGSALGCYNTRTIACIRSPDNVHVADAYCASIPRPSTLEYCYCNCTCACCCD